MIRAFQIHVIRVNVSGTQVLLLDTAANVMGYASLMIDLANEVEELSCLKLDVENLIDIIELQFNILVTIICFYSVT